MVQHLEFKQGTDQENQVADGKEGELTTPDVLEGQTDQSVPIPRGASTPIPVGETEDSHLSLTALESALVIATSSGSQYPELLTAAEEVQGDQFRTAPQSEEDNTSSLYEVPALPGNEPKVRFLADLSEGEKTSEETSSLGKLALNGHIPGIDGPELRRVTSPDRVPHITRIPLLLPLEDLMTSCPTCLGGRELSSKHISWKRRISTFFEDIRQWLSKNCRFIICCGF